MPEAKSTRQIGLVVLTRAGLECALRIQPYLEGDVHIYASERAMKALSTPPTPTTGTPPQHPAAGHPQGMPLQWYEHTSRADSYHCRGIPCGCPAAGVGDVGHITRFDAISLLLPQLWKTHDQLVLFFALGAAIRLIAPLLQDKQTDPGVVVIDDTAKFAISVVSGHAGGANDLTEQCAYLLGAVPVVTTASDLRKTLAVDLLGDRMGWRIEDPSQRTAVSAAIVNAELVAILQEAGQRDWWESTQPWPTNLVHVQSVHEVRAAPFAALLIISDRLIEDLPEGLPIVVCRPPSLVLGVGCRRGISFAALDEFIKTTLQAYQLALQSVAVLASADIKADETALQALAKHYSLRFETHTVEALKAVTAIPTPSEHVERLTGTPSVSEAAALLSSHDGQLVVCKQKGVGMTLAVARRLY